MTEFVTWAYLGTMAGATAFTMLVTQFIKGIGFIDRIPTRIVSYVVALVTLVAAFGFTGVTGVSNYALCVVNALIVALASNGGYDVLNQGISSSNKSAGDKDE